MIQVIFISNHQVYFSVPIGFKYSVISRRYMIFDKYVEFDEIISILKELEDEIDGLNEK